MITGTAGCVIGLIGLGWFFHTSVAFQHADASIALARILSRLTPGDRAAVTGVIGLLVEAAGEDYGVIVASPVPL